MLICAGVVVDEEGKDVAELAIENGGRGGSGGGCGGGGGE